MEDEYGYAKPLSKQFHPLSQPAPEYQLHPGGKVEVPGAGVYAASELRTKQKIANKQRELGMLHPDAPAIFSQPAQGRLFNPDAAEAESRAVAMKANLTNIDTNPAAGYKTVSMLMDVAEKSKVPSSHFSRLPDTPITAITTEDPMSKAHGEPEWGGGMVGTGGYYVPSFPKADAPLGRTSDIVAVNQGNPDYLMHELGHRHHYGPTYSSSRFPNPVIEAGLPRNPDPLQEAHADAYAERWGGELSRSLRAMKVNAQEDYPRYLHHQYTGYSTGLEASSAHGWNQYDRALYSGVRAHHFETGENVNYSNPEDIDAANYARMSPSGMGDADYHPLRHEQDTSADKWHPAIDATIHGLMQTSPHARQAWEDTGTAQHARDAARRHQDRLLMHHGQNIQGAMFEEMRGRDDKVLGYVPHLASVPAEHQQRADKEYWAGLDRAEQQDIDVMPHHMSVNQFGERPRTQMEVNRSLGISPEASKQRGFTEWM